MVYREVKYVPGFFKIVDEILVNAADNKVCSLNLNHRIRANSLVDKRFKDGHLESDYRHRRKYDLSLQQWTWHSN